MGMTASRRGVLSAIALSPVVIAAPSLASASEFAARMTEYQTARATADAFARNVYEPCFADFERMVAATPHKTVRWEPPLDHAGRFYGETWSTADATLIKNANYFLNAPGHVKPITPGQEPYAAACRKLLAAADAREAEIDAVRARCGLDAALARTDALEDAAYEKLLAMIACPVADAKELAAKIAFVDENDLWESPLVHNAIGADARALA